VGARHGSCYSAPTGGGNSLGFTKTQCRRLPPFRNRLEHQSKAVFYRSHTRGVRSCARHRQRIASFPTIGRCDMQLNTVSSPSYNPERDAQAGKIALLVDPDPLLLAAGKLLLAGHYKSVRTACTCIDVCNLLPEEEPQFAVLSDRLGPFQLTAVAEYVWHRWPRTRTLLFGRTASSQIDRLSDGESDVGLSNMEFLAAIESYASKPDWTRIQIGSAHTTRTVARCPIV